MSNIGLLMPRTLPRGAFSAHSSRSSSRNHGEKENDIPQTLPRGAFSAHNSRSSSRNHGEKENFEPGQQPAHQATKVSASPTSIIDPPIGHEDSAHTHLSTYEKTALFNGPLPTQDTPQPFSRSFIFSRLAPWLRIGSTLGKGAFGEVRKISLADPLRPGQGMRMAAKFFSDCTAKNQASIQNEFQALQTLRGKHGIIQLIKFDLMVEGSMVGYAMEMGTGSLTTIRSKAPLSLDATFQLAYDLITGGCSLATAGLVHRDCKPDNVVKVGSRWKKVDFGLVTTEGAPFRDCGSVLYRSPESYGVGDTSLYRTSSKQDVFADGLIIAETLLSLLPEDPKRPATIIHNQNELSATAPLWMHVAYRYEARFYAPAVARLAEVQVQFPKSAALVALVIHMIAEKPAERPSYFECREAFIQAELSL